jgi:hypothetical protein
LPLHFLLRRRPFFFGAAASSSSESVLADIFAGVFPSFFSSSTPIGQNINLGIIPNLVHCQLFTHLAIAYILMKRADNSGRMNVWDVVLYTAESLYVLAQVFTLFLGDEM